MFHEMRRKKQILSKENCISVLNRGTSGVLAVSGDDDYPYTVPISYVYKDGKIIFHCAKTGYKLECIERNEKVSFCVIDQDKIAPEEYTTYFRSVIAFGKAHILDEELAKRNALEILASKYCLNDKEGILNEIKSGFSHVCMVEIDIEHLSGKEAIEIIREKNAMRSDI